VEGPASTAGAAGERDSGGAEGAPDTMLHALPNIISEARRRGLRPVALREMLETGNNTR
jgi:hypothetical protein